MQLAFRLPLRSQHKARASRQLGGTLVEYSWNVMAHGRGNWRMEWVASTLHTTSEYCVSSTTTATAHTSAASSRLNWRPRRFKWIRPFRRKTKSGFCACAITFQLACISVVGWPTASRLWPNNKRLRHSWRRQFHPELCRLSTKLHASHPP